MRGMEGPLEILLAGIVIGGIGGCTIGVRVAGGTGGDDPRADNNLKCEEAWAAEYDGDDETVNETVILDEAWCQEHLDMVETEEVIEQNEVQAEAVAP